MYSVLLVVYLFLFSVMPYYLSLCLRFLLPSHIHTNTPADSFVWRLPLSFVAVRLYSLPMYCS